MNKELKLKLLRNNYSIKEANKGNNSIKTSTSIDKWTIKMTKPESMEVSVILIKQ